MQLSVVRGDITRHDVDVIVNAANPGLLGGGGVDGAIHRAGGPAILAECRQRKAELPHGQMARGQAVATTAGNLPARWVVHTAGPVYTPHEDQSGVLASCYQQSLRLAERLGARSIAFRRSRPESTGGRSRMPRGSPCGRSVGGRSVPDVRFVLFTDEAMAAFTAAVSADPPPPTSAR